MNLEDLARERVEASADDLIIAGRRFASRLILGTAGYPNQHVLLEALAASGASLATVAIRRISLEAYAGSLVELLDGRVRLLPNTSGCATARDAVLTARLSREALGTEWIKLEIIGERDTLYPDVAELHEATDLLVRDGFIVLPYCTDVPVACRKLADAGAAAVMPLGAPIGSGLGIQNRVTIRLIVEGANVPVLVDAGVGTASDAAVAMELGCTGVLMNTAIAEAKEPVRMARAMKLAVEAGRMAYLSGRMGTRKYADPSSPLAGLI